MNYKMNSAFVRICAVLLSIVMIVCSLAACSVPEVPDVDNPGSNENPDVGGGGNEGVKPDAPGIDPDNTDKPEEDDKENGVAISTDLGDNSLAYGSLVSDVVIGDNSGIGATIPAYVKIAEGASSLMLSVKPIENDSSLTLGEGETAESLDVHIEGIAKDNRIPMVVNLGAALSKGLNSKTLKLYHIENGAPVLMTRVESRDDFAIHNQYTYNAETGEVSIYVSSFSVFAAVETKVDVWDGSSADTEWYIETEDVFTLNSAAEFVGFRDLVDGGNTFEGKTVKLGIDIDLDNVQFDPIGFGYAHSGGQAFMGVFDGDGHTVYNIAQNGWSLDPDKTSYSTYTYSTAGGGLFASVKNATIKNLAVSGANIVFECVDIGVLVGYAQGDCTFENIVISNAKIANYNRATGGVVGEVCFGSYGTDITLGFSHVFRNVTVDSTVKVSSLWGSFDTLCGGVVGGKWGDATVLMEDVTVAAELDVFSDVTAAYQWYAYRRCGMLIGHTEQNSPKSALNAAAPFLKCEDVSVYYGDWVNYTYYEYLNQDNATGRRYPWVRAEAGEHNEAFSNARYGVPTHNGVKVSGMEFATNYTPIIFNQLYGGGQGVYGCAEHDGVTVYGKTTTTFYIKNNLGWENLRLHYWFKNGGDVWTTVVEGFKLTEENGAYMVSIPAYADGFKIVADNQETSAILLSDIEEGGTYNLNYAPGVAEVGGVVYDSFEEAIENADGKEIIILKDVELESAIVIDGKNVIINLNGKTIIASFNANAVNESRIEVLLVKNGANVTIIGDGSMLATGDGEYVEVISVIDDARLVIEGGNFISDGCTAIYATRGAVVTINGGKFEAKEEYFGKLYTLDVDEREIGNLGTIIVNGGSFVAFNPADHNNDGDYSNKVAEHVHAVLDEASNTYVIEKHSYAADGFCECGIKVTEYEFTFGENGDGKHSDGSEADAYTEENVLTLLLEQLVSVYENARDEMGNSCLKIGTNKSIGSFSFTVPDGVERVIIYVAGYKENDAVVEVNGVQYTITTHSIDGEYTAIEVDTTENKTVNFTTVESADLRCMINAISFAIYEKFEEHVCDEGVTIPAVDPTCTLPGLTEGKICSVCGKITVAQTPVDALGHTETPIPAVDATCTKSGLTEGVKCSVCGVVIVEQQVVDALGHNYVDGACDREGCNAVEPVDLTGRYYIATIRTSGNYWYMTSDLGTASTKRYQAVDTGLTILPTSITSPEAKCVFVLVANGDGTYSIYAEGVEGDNYLGWTSENSGILVSEENALKLNIDAKEDGTYNIYFMNGSETRTLSLNSNSGNNYFAWYKGTNQRVDLTLIPVVEGGEPDAPSCEHANKTTVNTATCTEGGTITVTCDACGEVVSTENVEAKGHNYVSGACTVCGEAEPTIPDEPETPVVPTKPVWNKVDVSDIKSTDIIVIVWRTSNGTTYAMSNDNGTGSAPTAVIVTVSGNQLTGDIAENVKWNITNNSGSLVIYPNGDTTTWLYCTNANNGVRVGTNTNKAFVIDQASGYLKNSGTNRYLGVYTANPDVRCYTSSTTTNIANQTIEFYRLETGTTEPDAPVCEHADTTTVNTATCTKDGTITVTCNECGEVVSTENVAAKGHNYVSGACTVCGEAEPVAPEIPKETTVNVNIGEHAAANGWTDSKRYESLKLGEITATAGGGNTSAKYYTSGNNWRFYQSDKGTITFTASEGVTILSVKITYTPNNGGVLCLGSEQIKSGTVVEVNADTITFSVGNSGSATNGQARITAIEIVYAAA